MLELKEVMYSTEAFTIYGTAKLMEKTFRRAASSRAASTAKGLATVAVDAAKKGFAFLDRNLPGCSYLAQLQSQYQALSDKEIKTDEDKSRIEEIESRMLDPDVG